MQEATQRRAGWGQGRGGIRRMPSLVPSMSLTKSMHTANGLPGVRTPALPLSSVALGKSVTSLSLVCHLKIMSSPSEGCTL